MRLKWFKDLKTPIVQIFVLSGLIIVGIAFYIPLSKYIRPTVISLLSPPLKLCQGISSNARQFARFEDLLEKNKRLKSRIDKLTAQLGQIQEAWRENQRLRGLLSLPQRKSFQIQTALLIGKDSSNWTKTVLINKGTSSGIKKGQPCVLGASLVGKVIETAPNVAKVSLIVDFNCKIPVKILRTREEGIVFGTLEAGHNVCKMKYIQKAKIGDEVISSGLGRVYPRGLLIGKVVKVEEEKNKLYKLAEVQPAIDFSSLEEVMVITGQ